MAAQSFTLNLNKMFVAQCTEALSFDYAQNTII